MTVASEISRLQTDKECIRQAIIDKWVDICANVSLDDYAACIDAIQGGWEWPTDWLNAEILLTAGGGWGWWAMYKSYGWWWWAWELLYCGKKIIKTWTHCIIVWSGGGGSSGGGVWGTWWDTIALWFSLKWWGWGWDTWRDVAHNWASWWSGWGWWGKCNRWWSWYSWSPWLSNWFWFWNNWSSSWSGWGWWGAWGNGNGSNWWAWYDSSITWTAVSYAVWGSGTSSIASCWSWGSWWLSSSSKSANWWWWRWWIVIISYDPNSWYTVSWWNCSYLCNWKCVHIFTSNWTLVVNQ